MSISFWTWRTLLVLINHQQLRSMTDRSVFFDTVARLVSRDSCRGDSLSRWCIVILTFGDVDVAPVASRTLKDSIVTLLSSLVAISEELTSLLRWLFFLPLLLLDNRRRDQRNVPIMSWDEEIDSSVNYGDGNRQRNDYSDSSEETVVLRGRLVMILCAPLVFERIPQHTESCEMRDNGQEEWIQPRESNHQTIVPDCVQPLEAQSWLRQQIPPAESDESQGNHTSTEAHQDYNPKNSTDPSRKWPSTSGSRRRSPGTEAKGRSLGQRLRG